MAHSPSTMTSSKQLLLRPCSMPDYIMMVWIVLIGSCLLSALVQVPVVQSFSSLPIANTFRHGGSKSINKIGFFTTNTILAAKLNSGEGEGKKRKRRRRKKKNQGDSAEKKGVSSAAAAAAAVASVTTDDFINLEDSSSRASTSSIKSESSSQNTSYDEENIDVTAIKDVARFSFGESGIVGTGNIDNIVTTTTSKIVEESYSSSSSEALSVEKEDGSIPLPKIEDFSKQKELESKKGRIEEKEDSKKKKIDRRDKQALLKLLEQDPYADADDSFFEEQEYTTVSALLGERAKPFLGIPIGPLQVGHFIGALVIVLMAFIDYPGFPLTNLPSPLRAALQGGLGTVYGINFILALFAVLKAGERGQPALLWIGKVFTVGGLALDQLTQLPTLEEVEAAKSRKRSRNNKRNYN